MPTLESLTIRGTLPDETFTERVEFPSLHTLRFADQQTPRNFGDETEETTKFLGWLQRFGGQLSSVSFQFYSVTRCTLSGFLENMRNVRTLDITSVYSPVSTINRFGEDNGVRDFAPFFTPPMGDATATLCPKLKKLRLNVAREGSVLNEEGVLEIIAGRRKRERDPVSSVSMIEEVDIAFGVVQTIDILGELKRRGVDIESFRFDATYPSRFRLSIFSPGTDS